MPAIIIVIGTAALAHATLVLAAWSQHGSCEPPDLLKRMGALLGMYAALCLSAPTIARLLGPLLRAWLPF